MEQLGKLLGRKSRDSEPEAGGGAADTGSLQPPDHSLPQAESETGVAPSDSSPFGLKFFLDSGEEMLFTALPVNIGRSDHNDIILARETVSSVHARVYFDDRIQAICIQDQDSLNGLLVDRLPTRTNILSDGMLISLGDAVITFRDTGYIHQR